VRAGDLEFRYRFWVIFGLFWLGFACYYVDHTNFAVWLVSLMAPRIDATARPVLQAMFGFAALLGIAAAGLRSWASAYLRSDVVHDTAVHTDTLVADGPYRHVRNPLYLGNFLLSLGMSLLMSRLGAAVIVLGQSWFLLRLIGREEAALAVAEGDRFRAYQGAVPRLLPSLAPRVPAGRAEAHWVEGVIGEAFTWILALAMVVFALTLNSRIIPIAVGGGFLVYWLLFAVWKKRGRTRGAAPRAS
jgi:protein-S-isoprenylcysteine O-methyltransferase Ste14